MLLDATSVHPRQAEPQEFIHRQELAGLRSARYRDVLWRYRIPFLNALPHHPGALYVTNCCGTKGIHLQTGTPDVFYTGPNQQRFIQSMKAKGLEWAILSDLYGIHFSDEELPLYDLAPDQLTQQELWNKGLLIRAKLFVRYGGLPIVVYVKGIPSTSLPYVIMLKAAGLTVAISSSSNYAR